MLARGVQIVNGDDLDDGCVEHTDTHSTETSQQEEVRILHLFSADWVQCRFVKICVSAHEFGGSRFADGGVFLILGSSFESYGTFLEYTEDAVGIFQLDDHRGCSNCS
jgi:hypothetical protein